MSTFKRLLNLGKGKLKVATKPSPPRDPSPDADGWVHDARHVAADAIEDLADAIRPDEASPAAAPREPSEATPAPAPEGAPDAPTEPVQPRKKRL